jgi:A/G-specific adenine glycosylase
VDPWAILVSEAMAQQTQAARAGEAWSAFMTRYPTPRALAEAPVADVLRAWRGLGYNRRALNLQRAAVRIVAEHGGQVPCDVVSLQRLPGVGPYTARAVAAIAFGQPVGAVDTNVRRVVSRLVGVEPGAVPPRELQALADRLVDHRRPADWTHAVMDIGATRCLTRRPVCDRCPLRPWCASRDRDRGTTKSADTRTSRTPFVATSRWLRGRIVERLRDAPAGAWVPFAEPIGHHDVDAVANALAGLARDGLLERRRDVVAGAEVARLPVAPSDATLPGR